MELQQLIPMLNVADIDASLEFYRRAPGFEIVSDPAMAAEWRWATIRSGRPELMLAETGSPPALPAGVDAHANTTWPVLFYFYPDDVRVLHARVVEAGYAPSEIAVTAYGMREFSLQDPDGHMLGFGEDADDKA